jgi:hypothetical protein
MPATADLQEPKAQRWRVISVLNNGAVALIYVGSSITQVRENYMESWKHLDRSVRVTTNKLIIEKWLGAADLGHWQAQAQIKIPQINF